MGDLTGLFAADEQQEKDLLYKLKELIDLYDDIKIQSDNLDETKSKFYSLEQECFSLMQQTGISNITIDGRNMFMRIDRFAQVMDKPRLHKWLRENGYADLLVENVNSQTLSAVMRELEDEGGDLPEYIKLIRKNKIGVRKAK